MNAMREPAAKRRDAPRPASLVLVLALAAACSAPSGTSAGASDPGTIEARLREGDPAGALALADRYVRARPADPQARVLWARARAALAVEEGDRAGYHEAVRFLDTPPGAEVDPEVLTWRARLEFGRRHVRHAVRDLALVLERRPADPVALRLTAFGQHALGRPKAEERAWRLADDRLGGDPIAAIGLARLLLGEEDEARSREGVEWLEKAESAPESPRWVLYVAALLRLARGEGQAAERDAERALDTPGDTPSEGRIQAALGRARLLRGDEEGALGAFERAAAAPDARPADLADLGALLVRRGRRLEGRRWLERALEEAEGVTRDALARYLKRGADENRAPRTAAPEGGP